MMKQTKASWYGPSPELDAPIDNGNWICAACLGENAHKDSCPLYDAQAELIRLSLQTRESA